MARPSLGMREGKIQRVELRGATDAGLSEDHLLLIGADDGDRDDFVPRHRLWRKRPVEQPLAVDAENVACVGGGAYAKNEPHQAQTHKEERKSAANAVAKQGAKQKGE